MIEKDYLRIRKILRPSPEEPKGRTVQKGEVQDWGSVLHIIDGQRDKNRRRAGDSVRRGVLALVGVRSKLVRGRKRNPMVLAKVVEGRVQRPHEADLKEIVSIQEN